MGFLYPRLLSGQAKSLHEVYKSMPVRALAGKVATEHESAVYAATGGDRISASGLRDLREKVVALARGAGFPNESRRDLRANFDLRLAELLHAEMGIVPAEAASGDVWSFLALVLLPDIAYWRYPMPPGDRVLGTDITRHVFGRLWWRAHLVHSQGDPAPYEALHILGEAAFDQIYSRRKALGASPHLVKAILRVWDGLNLDGLEEREILRDFLKRLLRLAPILLFEALDDRSLDAELRAVARESVMAALNASDDRPPDLQDRADTVMSGPAGIRVAEPVSPTITASDPGAIGSSEAVSEDQTSDAQPPAEQTDQVGGTVNGPQVYKAYEGPSFGEPNVLGLNDRAEAIVAVVTVEGPVKAERVYRLITRLAEESFDVMATDLLVAATKYAIRRGHLLAEDSAGRGGFPCTVLRLPGQPACILRERGQRELDEIPDRELLAAAELIRAERPELGLTELAQQTMALFGEERGTADFREILIEVLRQHGE